MGKVIIDGVDVSWCNMKCDNGDCALYYAELNNDNNELIYGFNCSDNQDCYYKQLKRKEQECEELKKLNNILNIAFTSISNSNIDKIIKQLQIGVENNG